jgi:tRNA 2-thiouridine synthesizing protein B
MALHIINKSPYQDRSLQDCLRVCKTGDELLLIEDAVYAALAENPYAEQLNDSGLNLYALSVDLKARGLANMDIGSVKQVSDHEFVALTVKHSAIQSWY